MKNLCFFVVALFIFIGCEANQLVVKVKQEPYWCISSAMQNGKTIATNFETGFTLYGTNDISGHFPVNGFGGKLNIKGNGNIAFGDVSWTEKGGPRAQMDEEMALQAIMFKVDKIAFDGPKLIMSNQAKGIKIVYTPCEYGYMKSLKANTWKFVGFEKKKNTGVVVMHADSKEQYKGLTALKTLKATFKCSGSPVYKDGSLFYDISGNLGVNSFTAKLVIDKDNGKKSIQKMQVTKKQVAKDVAKEEQAYITYLSDLAFFSYAHNNLHINTKDNVELVFSKAK